MISYADRAPASTDPCISLHVITDPNDGGFHPPRIPGISNGTFEVPAGGVSANHKMYVYFTNGTNEKKTMLRSYLGVSEDDGYTFSKRYLFSSQFFINVSPEKVRTADYPELPTSPGGNSILLFGSGWYRQSSPYLSVVDETQINHKKRVRYFAGLDSKTLKPRWSSHEKYSAPLFKDPCIGELSVKFDSHSGQWLTLYNCDNKIVLRHADKPWGPWSNGQVIFDPHRDGAYCKYIHKGYQTQAEKCDDLSDEDQEDGSGGVYGPYMIPSLYTGDPTEETIVYTMSIHNPYQTVLMKSRLKIGGL